MSRYPTVGQMVAQSKASVDSCRINASIHRGLAESANERMRPAHIAWAEAYEARAGKPAEEAAPGDPCGILDVHGPDLPFASICEGTLHCWIDVNGAVPDCHCHLSPPCGACLEAPLVCDTCKETVP